MNRRTASLSALLLGSLLTFVLLNTLPRLRLGAPSEEDIVLVIPALAEETYTYQATRGFTAVLSTQGGQRLELPANWLPSEPKPGASFRVRTELQPSPASLSLNAVVTPAD